MDVRAFTGQAKFCKKAAAGYSNCCMPVLRSKMFS
ncbi:conjugal transfer protein TraN [Escherichia coli]